MRALVLSTKILDAAVAAVEHLERAFCALAVVLFCGLLSVNVGLRYVLAAPLYYAEEVCVILMIWMAFVASSLAVGSRDMVAVTLLPDMLPPGARRWLAVVVQVLVFLIAAVFLYWSVTWLRSPSASRDVILTLGMPKWPSYLVIPVFFGLILLKSARNVGVALKEAKT